MRVVRHRFTELHRIRAIKIRGLDLSEAHSSHHICSTQPVVHSKRGVKVVLLRLEVKMNVSL